MIGIAYDDLHLKLVTKMEELMKERNARGIYWFRQWVTFVNDDE